LSLSFGTQTGDFCQYDIRAFWAAKSTFRAERHREREKARLAGGGHSLERTVSLPNPC
jgi:hypothetical protein